MFTGLLPMGAFSQTDPIFLSQARPDLPNVVRRVHDGVSGQRKNHLRETKNANDLHVWVGQSSHGVA